MIEERLCGCKLRVLNTRFSGLQASAVDRTEKRLMQTFCGVKSVSAQKAKLLLSSYTAVRGSCGQLCGESFV